MKWAFEPIVRRLPWNHAPPQQTWPGADNISSALTIADLYLLTADGKHAIYTKTGNYNVRAGPLTSYFEGVTASHHTGGFSTELGAILHTNIEHGFSVSQIELGTVLTAGASFRNVYRAQLDDCFTAIEEHWTQEIAVPTTHLTIRIHFPPARPPVLVRCKRVVGLAEYQINTAASICELFGQPAIVWEIAQPKPGDIYKLEWRW